MDLEKIKQFIFKAVGKKGTDINTICEKLNIQPYELLGVVELLKQDGCLVDVIDGKVYKLSKPITVNDVLDAHKFIDNMGADWMKYIPDDFKKVNEQLIK